MNLLIISDLHIGTGDRFGTFGWDSDKFIDTIEKIKSTFKIDKTILNGDIYELYKYKIKDIIEKQKKLVEYLGRDEFIYIRGNHDLVNDFGLDKYILKNSAGKTIYFEHGHNADFLNGTSAGRIISRIFFKFLKKIILSGFFNKLYIKLVEHDEELHSVRKYNTYSYLKYALRLLKHYDVVILGHTHKVETHKTYYLNQKKKYLNSGSCCLGRFQGIILNTESLKYETIKIDRGGKIADEISIESMARLQSA
jgi:predicted phosphodiesterase